MGTFLEVRVFEHDPGQVRDILREAFSEVGRLERQMSAYLPESEVSLVNALAGRRAVRLERDLFDLLSDSIDFSLATGGAFDVTAGSPKETANAGGKAKGAAGLRLNPRRQSVRFDSPLTNIDLGGIAKGYAVNRIALLLADRGISNALVNFGGSSMYGLGSPPGDDAWQVSVRHPLDPGEAALTVRLRGRSLSTSGNCRGCSWGFGQDDHIFDPRTGRPAEGALGATVISPSGVESEAWSTALCVLGADRGRELLRGLTELQAYVLEGSAETGGFLIHQIGVVEEESSGIDPTNAGRALREMNRDHTRI